MDRSTFRHRLAVLEWDESHFDVFVRTDDGTVEHYWRGETQMFGPENLGGHFDSDPVVTDLSGLHLIGRSGSQLVDWTWSERQPGWLGAPTVLTLPGLAVAEPEVIVTGGALHVFVPSLDGPMRHWSFTSLDDGWSDPDVLTADLAAHDTRPCALTRTDGSIDLFSVAQVDRGLLHWFNDANGWHCERRTNSEDGRKLSGRPAAVAPTEHRMDVFAVRSDGVPVHWGWDGRSWFDDEVRLGSAGALPDDEITLVSSSAAQVTFVARVAGTDGGAPRVVTWDLDPRPPAVWRGPDEVEASVSPVSAWLFSSAGTGPGGRATDGQMGLLTRATDGSFTQYTYTYSTKGSIDGTLVARSKVTDLPRAEPPGPDATFVPAVVDPDLLARRPDDLVLMGVRWNDSLEVVAGPPPQLLAHAGAELTVTLPPQHVAEQVVFGDGPAQPSADPQFTGHVPLWASSSSGPSRVTITLEDGTRWPLTVEGVLDALHHGHLVPAADLTDSHTQLELPYRLLMTPFRPDGADIALDHVTRAAAGPTGTVGLWSTRVSAAGNDPTAAAGLTLRPLGAVTDDPFPTSLSGGMRGRILVEPPTATIDRLRLSSLGASFTAGGVWDTFSWDHVASLGRDQLVRIATEGVLYPFGNRAVYVETSERRLDTTTEDATAHLRKHAMLIVTEPVRELPPSRAFPFTEVRLQRTTVDFAQEPVFTKKEFPSPATAELLQTIVTAELAADGLKPTIESGGVGAIPVEDLAFIDEITTPDAAAAAATYVTDWVGIKAVQEKLDVLTAGGSADVDAFLVPADGGGPILFPVRLAGPSGEVHVDLPVVFVVDTRLPDGLLHPAFHSLEDPVLFGQVQDAYHDVGDGDVTIGPVRLDMVGAAAPRPTDRPEVRRLHVAGERRDGGFAPRLGPDKEAALLLAPERRWAFEMALPELSTLVGHQAPDGVPTLLVRQSQDLLDGVADPKLLFQTTVPTAAAIKTTFSGNSARTGGIAAPDLCIDGVARDRGPVHADTFAQQVLGQPVDPTKFLSDTATLLGFSLAELLDGAHLSTTPEILSDPNPGRPPTVTMRWSQVPLVTTTGAFVTSPDTTVDLEVTLAPDQQQVRCTITDATLAFPDRGDKALLELRLGKIEFRQQGGGVPSIDVSDVSTEFRGFLTLLDDLQNAVKLGDGAPAVHASDTGVTATFDVPVPDLTTGAFQLTGLAFHGVIDVPFDVRPVTIELAFASRDNPFNVSVLALGGGGYVDLVLDSTGLKRLEIALEFGASLEVNFVVATGEVHAMGGIRVVGDTDFTLAGYLRFGGMVEVLGLVSASVELVLTLAYDTDSNAMTGRATLVLEVDLLLFSDSVELDSGLWVLAGDPPAAPHSVSAPAVDPEAWRSYRAAFDSEALT